MALPQGINFRATSGYVTDGANEYGQLQPPSGGNYPTTTAQGNTVGWEGTAYQQIGSRDRSAAVDSRLAGINYTNTSAVANYRIDLPAAGNYGVRIAAGDAVYAQTVKVELFDTSTSLGVLASGAVAAASFADATGSVYSAANWPTSNALLTKAFSTTICRFAVGDTAGNPRMIAHVYVEAAAPAGVTGTIATTEADDTTAASGTLTVSGSSATTEANDVSAISGTVGSAVTGSIATTEADDTTTAAATLTVSASSSTTEQDDTTAANASLTVSGSNATTEADDVTAASGTITVSGASATVEADDTTSTAASLAVSGSSATTDQDDASAISAHVGSDISGSIASVEQDDTTAAAGAIAVTGVSNTADADDAAAVAGTISISGSGNTAEQNDASTAAGQLSVSGAATWVETDDVTAAAGAVGAVVVLIPSVKNYYAGKARVRNIVGAARVRTITGAARIRTYP